MALNRSDMEKINEMITAGGGGKAAVCECKCPPNPATQNDVKALQTKLDSLNNDLAALKELASQAG